MENEKNVNITLTPVKPITIDNLVEDDHKIIPLYPESNVVQEDDVDNDTQETADENEEQTTNLTEEVKPDNIEEATTETVEESNVPAPVLDEENLDNPLNNKTEAQIGELMKTLRNLMGMMESQWEASRKEYHLNDAIMKKLFDFNTAHRITPPEGLTAEELVKWNTANEGKEYDGFDSITEEDVVNIFGAEHKIIGITHDVTITRIKDVCRDFFSWISSISEYRKIHDSYMELIEYQERKNLEELQKKADEEEDPEKKAVLQASINVYYSQKYLDFLSIPLEEKQVNRLVSTFSNKQRVEYLLERARVKLQQMQISSKFILEISQFEKRFLPEKYHSQNNIFLLYFMELLVYAADTYNKKDENSIKVTCIVFGLDRVVRRSWSPEIYNRIITNVIAFEEQFVSKLSKVNVSNIVDKVMIP